MNIYKYKLESVCYKAAKLIIILIWYSSNGNEVPCLLSKGRCVIKKGSVMFCYFFFFLPFNESMHTWLRNGPYIMESDSSFSFSLTSKDFHLHFYAPNTKSHSFRQNAALIARGNGAGVKKFSVSLSPGHHRTCVCSAIWMVLSKYCNLQKQ